MSKYLITQSLLSAWLYQYDAEDGEQAHDAFMQVLRREETERTEAMQNGIDFENAVTEYLNGAEKRGTVKTVGDLIRGSQLQVPVHAERNICNLDFVLYGRLDALKAGVIYDIKYSKNYVPGKYLNSPQHPMYLECLPQAREFRYIISDGKDVFQERYTRLETPPIDRLILDFLHFLDDFGLKRTYFELWEAD